MMNIEDFKERFAGFDNDTIVEIIDLFIQEYDDRINNISQFIVNQNFTEFKKEVHAFKGVMSNFDAECLAYQKIFSMHHEASLLKLEMEKGIVFSKEELGHFFNKMAIEFEVFKPASFEMLNDLKALRNAYL